MSCRVGTIVGISEQLVPDTHQTPASGLKSTALSRPVSNLIDSVWYSRTEVVCLEFGFGVSGGRLKQVLNI